MQNQNPRIYLIKYYLELLDEGEQNFEAKDVTGGEFFIVYKLEEIDVINKYSEIDEEAFSTGVPDTSWRIQLVSRKKSLLQVHVNYTWVPFALVRDFNLTSCYCFQKGYNSIQDLKVPINHIPLT